ncbi:ferrochelatase [Candidatus Endolissoclinum faulkneri L2]|uniref:Ferrochelatase n=1 Tax=Candidatus Endolissoclinum faulkneri L2 TaxID=1193729 RepID=K7YNP0_9PROT|nr:ferrochelatase [Candidatus Endolissoclinum faulkneri]AFX98239.1 ferrochelatase [Candidatus Endolissoclinum faulkneri L2]
MIYRTVCPTSDVPNHPTLKIGLIGVLLVNLGTPDSTDIPDVRRYLAQFLSDRRVIEFNPILWKLILHCFILRTRPQKTSKAYRAIWMKESKESPLRHYTREEAVKLKQRLDPTETTLIVDWAMRYGRPSIGDRMRALQKEGCDRMLIVPLYPQYAASTTGTVIDEVARELLTMRWQPAIRIHPAFYDDPAYIEAVATCVEKHLSTLKWQPEVILASFHGLPKRYLLSGDPYHCHCLKTARLLRERLRLNTNTFRLAFQSRFGKEEWLQPYTDEVIAALSQNDGFKRLVVVMPGFIADCVETLEEIGMQGCETFKKAGGTHFSIVPCVNYSDAAINMLETLIINELCGWWSKC